MNLTLTRFAYLPSCTLGELVVGPLTLATIERPWIPNQNGPGGTPFKSCVPDGDYHLQRWDSERFPWTFALVNNVLGVYLKKALIPPRQEYGRSEILIHIGNNVHNVVGCIAVGTHHVPGEHAVFDSAIAMNRLRAVLGSGYHNLTIKSFSAREIAA